MVRCGVGNVFGQMIQSNYIEIANNVLKLFMSDRCHLCEQNGGSRQSIMEILSSLRPTIAMGALHMCTAHLIDLSLVIFRSTYVHKGESMRNHTEMGRRL